MAEKKQRFPGVIGPAYTLKSERFDAQELINYYLELDETGGGKGQEPAAAMPTPGLEFLQTIGSGPIRCTYTQSNDQLMYVVSGNEIYQLSGALGVPVRLTGNLLTTNGPVQATDNGISVVFVDGLYGYYTDIGSLVLNQIVSANFHATQTITYQDGYFIGVDRGTQAFFISDINAVTWQPLNEENAQGSPDILIAAISNNRQLYLLGSKSTETWYDEGSSFTSPFVRQDGKFSQIGCAAPASIAVLQETFFWLGSNAQGGGVVYGLINSMPTRVSNYNVERTIQEQGTLSAATGFSYQQEGHYFYCLNVPGLDFTWVYDMSTAQWHKRMDTITGNNQRCIAETHGYLNNDHIIGDYRNGNIYRYNLDVWTSNGNVIYRVRQFPHSSNNLNINFYRMLELDFQMGVGLPYQPVTCGYVQSNLDANTSALWHYNETDNIMVNSANITQFYDLTGSSWALTPNFGLCQGGLHITGLNDFNEYGFAGEVASEAQTFEVAIYNPGGQTGTEIEMFRNDMYRDNLDSTATMLGYLANIDTSPTLDFRLFNGITVITSCPLPVGSWTIICWEFDTTTNTISMYSNGAQFYTSTISSHWAMNMPLTMYSFLDFFSGTDITIDELRQSNVFRYTGSSYLTTQTGNTVGINPRVALYLSRDGGETFGLPRYAYLGKLGKYKNRVRFGPLGSARDMVMKIVVSEPVRVVFLSGYLDWEAGLS